MVIRRHRGRALVLLVLIVGGLALVLPAAPAQAAPPYPPVHGSVSGPATVSTSSNSTYYINGSGGPAIASNGTEIGAITWTAKILGADLTGVSVAPNGSTFSGTAPGVTHLKVGKVVEGLTLSVEITSTYQSTSRSTNLTYPIRVVVPYVVHTTLYAGARSNLLAFDVTVKLDGQPVGTVSVPSIAPNKTYNFTFDYATTGLSAGEHSFTISLASEQGLVTFAGGALEYSQSFYVVGPAPNYPLWVGLGALAFFGVLFIFVTRVAARRRSSAHK